VAPVERLRPPLLTIVWLLTLVDLLGSPAWAAPAAVVALVAYLATAVGYARRETLAVCALVGAAIAVLLWRDGEPGRLEHGLERALLFAALLPTLRMTRAAIRRLGAVVSARGRPATPPERWADVGVPLGSHVFGSMLNTGAFAIMSSVVPEGSSAERRQRAAEASLRGMNVAVLWSPFFVGFAVAGTYLPAVEAWQVSGLGLVIAAGALLVGLAMFGRPFEPRAVVAALGCLGPIVPGMLLAGGAVVACGSLTALSTLGSVLVVMPPLALAAVLAGGATPREVARETFDGMRLMGDDMLLIAAAMGLGTVAEASASVREALAPLVGGGLAPSATLALVVFSMLLPAMAGVHPMITGTVLLGAVTGAGHTVSDLALMEAMLVGWGLGSMVSISSLSVVTSGAMYGAVPLRLAYGRNLAPGWRCWPWSLS
jgi:hypothetical protein